MGTTFKARFTNGVLKPLEKLDLKEGEEVSLSLGPASPSPVLLEALDANGDFLERTAGAWKSEMDCDEFIRRIYEARELGSRTPIKK